MSRLDGVGAAWFDGWIERTRTELKVVAREKEGDVAEGSARFSESELEQDADTRVRDVLARIRAGRMSRRQVLSYGLRAGLARPAILGLMAAGEVNSQEVRRGIAYLLNTQQANGLWEDVWFNAPGFPRVFYLRYHGYAKYFPLWALTRYYAMSRKVFL